MGRSRRAAQLRRVLFANPRYSATAAVYRLSKSFAMEFRSHSSCVSDILSLANHVLYEYSTRWNFPQKRLNMAINEAKTVQIYLPTDEDTFFLRQQDMFTRHIETHEVRTRGTRVTATLNQ